MHATHATNTSIETLQQPLIEPGEPDLKAFLRNVSRLNEVEGEPQPEARVCTAHGCRLKKYLAQVRITGFGKRVLCPIHLLDLVEREVGLGE
jgi:hypothetical protein